MTRKQFLLVVKDIENKLDPGEGYRLEFYLRSGQSFVGSWTWLERSVCEVLVISQNDVPPIYTTLASVESIVLAA